MSEKYQQQQPNYNSKHSSEFETDNDIEMAERIPEIQPSDHFKSTELMELSDKDLELCSVPSDQQRKTAELCLQNSNALIIPLTQQQQQTLPPPPPLSRLPSNQPSQSTNNNNDNNHNNNNNNNNNNNVKYNHSWTKPKKSWRFAPDEEVLCMLDCRLPYQVVKYHKALDQGFHEVKLLYSTEPKTVTTFNLIKKPAVAEEQLWNTLWHEFKQRCKHFKKQEIKAAHEKFCFYHHIMQFDFDIVPSNEVRITKHTKLIDWDGRDKGINRGRFTIEERDDFVLRVGDKIMITCDGVEALFTKTHIKTIHKIDITKSIRNQIPFTIAESVWHIGWDAAIYKCNNQHVETHETAVEVKYWKFESSDATYKNSNEVFIEYFNHEWFQGLSRARRRSREQAKANEEARTKTKAKTKSQSRTKTKSKSKSKSKAKSNANSQ